MLSDLILSFFAFFCFFQIKNLDDKWKLFFLFMGFSSFVGGFFHGYPIIGEHFKFISWSFLCLSLIYAQLAAYQNDSNIAIKTIFIVKSVILLVLAILNNAFDFLIIDIAISMFGFIVLGNLIYIRDLSIFITYGIIVSFSSAFIVITGFYIHPLYCTANDIGHYISIISLILIYKGARFDYYKRQLESSEV